MIRAVVFDIGDVVCAFRPERRLDDLARATGLSAARIHGVIWASGLDRRAEAGLLSPADTQRLTLEALENRIDADALRAAWSTAFAPDPAVCALVARLEVRTFAFTNNGPLFTACLPHELAEVDRLFQRVICSWHLRACKPDPVAFERLGAELHRPPADLLFVDDNPVSAEAARQVGLSAVTFTSAERLADELRQAGVGRA